MDVNYVILIAVALIMGLAYGIIGYFSAYMKAGESLDYRKLAATMVYSVIIALIAVQTGVLNFQSLANWQAIFDPMWQTYFGIYLALIYVFSKIVIPVVSQLTSKTTLYPRKASVDPARKMDQETRRWLVSDQPALNSAILKAVDEAEAKVTWRYAIEAGAWIYLVEFGEVTGAKHYFFRGWFGTSVVSWKPITSECLEAIRKTGKFPEYSDLY
jgi:hypothetical protein